MTVQRVASFAELGASQANLARRHLTTSQRAMLAARLADLPPHRPSKTPPIGGVTEPEAARTFAVGTRTVQRAKKVKAADPELAEKVEQGAVTLDAAAKTIQKREQAKQRRRTARARRPSPSLPTRLPSPERITGLDGKSYPGSAA